MASTIISAVVPNYNHGHLVGQAIASLLAQSRPFDEIIIVDDGSTDDSVAVINEITAFAPQVRLVRHSKNEGAVAAINTGIREAAGNYLHFGGADDDFYPNLVDTTATLLDAHSTAGLACGEANVIDQESGTALGRRPPTRPSLHPRFFSPEATSRLLRKTDNFILTHTTLFRRAALLDAGGFLSTLGPFSDGYLVRRIALSHGFCYAPTVLANWKVSELGFSRTSARDPLRARALLDQAVQQFSADPVFPTWYPRLFERRFMFNTARLAALAEPTDYDALARLVPRYRWLGLTRGLPASLKRIALLTMLTLYFRPLSLLSLAGARISRWGGA